MKKIKKIKEVCTISGGYAFKSNDFTRQGIPIIRIGDIYGNKVNISSSTVFFKEYNEKLNKFIIEKGDILVALSGATTGKFGIYDEDIQALLNQRVAKISSKENINNNYLYHYMNKLQNIIYNKALGCAQPNISPNQIGEIEIYIPSRLEQDKISDVLDIAKGLIDKRKKQIEELDLLVKSKFIEMFGESDDYVTVSYYIDSLLAGKSLMGEEECKNKVLKTGSVSYDYFNKSEVKNLPLDYIPNQKHLAKVGDLLISRMNTVEFVGATAYIWSVNDNTYIPDRLWKAIIKKDVNPIFLWQLLIQQKTKEQIRKAASGTSGSMKNISKQGFLGVKVTKVDFEKQNQFADFVKQVDKLKFEMEKSLKELEDNFNSLMQKAFKGELFK